MAALRILKKVKTKMAVATRYGFVAWEYQFKNWKLEIWRLDNGD